MELRDFAPLIVALGGIAFLLLLIPLSERDETVMHETAHSQSCIYFGGNPETNYTFADFAAPNATTMCHNLTTYEAWFGYNLSASLQEVKDYQSDAQKKWIIRMIIVSSAITWILLLMAIYK